MRDVRRVAILISGRGSNMRALVEKAQGYEVAIVATNKRQAEGTDWARQQGLATWACDSKGVDKLAYDQALSAVLDEHRVGTVALAGFMRILTPWFIEQWRGCIVNIHPSLLPKHRGLDTHARALEAGDTVAGCSVHLVTEELDAGDVLGQVEVPIEASDTPAALEQRVLAAEHELYPRILSEFVRR
jgi:phosphoribosylglycinamide formyltransferase-1